MQIKDEKQKLKLAEQQTEEADKTAAGQAGGVYGDLGESNEALVTDGFLVPDLDTPADEEPPAYGELHEKVQFSQPGFDVGAEITGTNAV